MYIFSSGSVEAQKLLFGHSKDGDLSKHLSGFYDTKIGPKQESDSYIKIAKEINYKEDEILFLTDIIKGEFLTQFCRKKNGLNIITMTD